jgi:hypothetical protein
MTDEGTGGAVCNTGLPGVCAPGHQQCQTGNLVCVQDTMSSAEVCNGDDDNCNGDTDEDTGGAVCNTGLQGVCAPGHQQCQSGSLTCVQDTPSSTELCENGLDEDCNGSVDEAGCSCAMAETVVSSTQTRINKVRLSEADQRDKVLVKGSFMLPMPGLIDPASQVVRVRLTDGQGLHYEGSIPAASFSASPSGRTFKFSDPSLANDGLKKAKFVIRGDETTVKYLFKAQGLNQPTFSAGTGTATVIVGTRCFRDDADTCTVSGSGSSARCQ